METLRQLAASEAGKGRQTVRRRALAVLGYLTALTSLAIIACWICATVRGPVDLTAAERPAAAADALAPPELYVCAGDKRQAGMAVDRLRRAANAPPALLKRVARPLSKPPPQHFVNVSYDPPLYHDVGAKCAWGHISGRRVPHLEDVGVSYDFQQLEARSCNDPEECKSLCLRMHKPDDPFLCNYFTWHREKKVALFYFLEPTLKWNLTEDTRVETFFWQCRESPCSWFWRPKRIAQPFADLTIAQMKRLPNLISVTTCSDFSTCQFACETRPSFKELHGSLAPEGVNPDDPTCDYIVMPNTGDLRNQESFMISMKQSALKNVSYARSATFDSFELICRDKELEVPVSHEELPPLGSTPVVLPAVPLLTPPPVAGQAVPAVLPAAQPGIASPATEASPSPPAAPAPVAPVVAAAASQQVPIPVQPSLPVVQSILPLAPEQKPLAVAGATTTTEAPASSPAIKPAESSSASPISPAAATAAAAAETSKIATPTTTAAATAAPASSTASAAASASTAAATGAASSAAPTNGSSASTAAAAATATASSPAIQPTTAASISAAPVAAAAKPVAAASAVQPQASATLPQAAAAQPQAAAASPVAAAEIKLQSHRQKRLRRRDVEETPISFAGCQLQKETVDCAALKVVRPSPLPQCVQVNAATVRVAGSASINIESQQPLWLAVTQAGKGQLREVIPLQPGSRHAVTVSPKPVSGENCGPEHTHARRCANVCNDRLAIEVCGCSTSQTVDASSGLLSVGPCTEQQLRSCAYPLIRSDDFYRCVEQCTEGCRQQSPLLVQSRSSPQSVPDIDVITLELNLKGFPDSQVQQQPVNVADNQFSYVWGPMLLVGLLLLGIALVVYAGRCL